MKLPKPCPHCGGTEYLGYQVITTSEQKVVGAAYCAGCRTWSELSVSAEGIIQDEHMANAALRNKQKAEESLLKSNPDSANKDDVIYRAAAIDAAMRDVSCIRTHEFNAGATRAANRIKQLPSAQPERKYTIEEVAEILASAIGHECACDINGIDEWLPERCKYTEIRGECPCPKEKHGCWMQFLLQGGAQI